MSVTSDKFVSGGLGYHNEGSKHFRNVGKEFISIFCLRDFDNCTLGWDVFGGPSLKLGWI